MHNLQAFQKFPCALARDTEEVRRTEEVWSREDETPKGKDLEPGGRSKVHCQQLLMPAHDPSGSASDTSSGFSEDRNRYTKSSRLRRFSQSQQGSRIFEPTDRVPEHWQPCGIAGVGTREMLKIQVYVDDTELI